MKRLLLAASLCALTASPAAAAPDPFAAFIANVVANPKAAAASLADCKLLLAPTGAARTPCLLTLDDFAGADRLEVSRLAYGAVKRSVLAYLDADVRAFAGGKVIGTYHVVAISSVMAPDSFAPAAMQVAKLVSDKDAAAKAKAKTLPPAPSIADWTAPPPKEMDDSDQDDRSMGLDELGRWAQGGAKAALADVAADDGIVFGSGPKQRYTGKAAGKAIKKWKLGLAASDDMTRDGDEMIVYGATDVVATMPDRTSLTYAALVVGVVRYDDMSGDHLWAARLVSFGVPQ
ncbi:MAG TPA: hypothetical protein VHE35_27735 [Kofleriaceae bacterium]|nr:hypothetical protein [Kofleriaceae bacterium]